MKSNRRKFLTMLGMGTASAPLAAKAAADEIIGQQTGVIKYGLAPGGSLVGYGNPSQSGVSEIDRAVKFADYVKLFGIPDFIDSEYRQSSKYVHVLDPDIACKKSWSMSVKIQHQRERNYQRHKDTIEHKRWFQVKKKTFREILGFDWEW